MFHCALKEAERGVSESEYQLFCWLQAMYHKGIEAYVRLLHEIGAINSNANSTGIPKGAVVHDEL